MIGKAYVSVFQFYDSSSNQMSFKKRPVLIVGQADENDYVILPISRVTNRLNIDSYYDFKITAKSTPLMNLKQTSYIRTHKQSVVHKGELIKEIIDFKTEYPDIFIEIIAKMEEFQNKLINDAL